jgi:hypothetical protein
MTTQEKLADFKSRNLDFGMVLAAVLLKRIGGSAEITLDEWLEVGTSDLLIWHDGWKDDAMKVRLGNKKDVLPKAA